MGPADDPRHDPHAPTLDEARKLAGLTHEQLWLRYFALGGMSQPLEVEALVCGALVAEPSERDRVAHALNERFVELGSPQRLPYLDDPG